MTDLPTATHTVVIGAGQAGPSEFGVPRHVRGISEVPGLTFIGILWQHTQASANFVGVAADADHLASQWQA